MGFPDARCHTARVFSRPFVITRTTVNFWLDVATLLVMLALTATGGIMFFVLPPGTGHSHFILGFGRHDIGLLHFYLAVSAVVMLGIHVALHWDWVACVVARILGREKPSRPCQMAWGVSLLAGTAALLIAVLWGASFLIEQPTAERAIHRGLGAHDSHWDRESPGEAPPIQEHSPGASKVEVHSALNVGTDGVLDAGATAAAHEADSHKHEQTCPAGAAINGRTTVRRAALLAGLDVRQLCARLDLPGAIDPGERLGRLKRQYGLSIHEVRRIACAGR